MNITDANGNTPLIFIIHKTGNFGITEKLLEKGAIVNTQNRTGETALMYAAWRGHSQIVQLLLEYRADVTLKNSQGDTALNIGGIKRTSGNYTDAPSGQWNCGNDRRTECLWL